MHTARYKPGCEPFMVRALCKITNCPGQLGTFRMVPTQLIDGQLRYPEHVAVTLNSGFKQVGPAHWALGNNASRWHRQAPRRPRRLPWPDYQVSQANGRLYARPRDDEFGRLRPFQVDRVERSFHESKRKLQSLPVTFEARSGEDYTIDCPECERTCRVVIDEVQAEIWNAVDLWLEGKLIFKAEALSFATEDVRWPIWQMPKPSYTVKKRLERSKRLGHSATLDN